MDRDAMKAAFEEVLTKLDLDPVECREGDGWWRFYPDGLSMQGGLHSHDLRVLAALTEIDHDASLDDVYASITERNNSLPRGSLAVFGEADNYLYVRSEVALEDVSPETIEAMITGCMALARSPAAQSLRSKYRAW